MKVPPDVSSRSQSSSCTSCFYKNASSKYNFLKRMVNLGPEANRHHSKDIPTRERKLLDKLISEYDKLKSELLSGINRNLEQKVDTKIQTYKKYDVQDTENAEKAGIMLELFKLVDKSEALRHSGLSECCSCCICNSSICSRFKSQRHRHCHAGGANYSSRSSVISLHNRTRNERAVRLKEKYVYSDPYTCTSELSSMITNQSKEINNILLQHKKPETKMTNAIEIHEMKKIKRPMKNYLQRVKHSELTINNVIYGPMRGEAKKSYETITVLVKESESKLNDLLFEKSGDRLKKFETKSGVQRHTCDCSEGTSEYYRRDKQNLKLPKLSTNDSISISTKVNANEDATTSETIIQLERKSTKQIPNIKPESEIITELMQEIKSRIFKSDKAGYRRSADKLSRRSNHRLQQARLRFYQKNIGAKNTQEKQEQTFQTENQNKTKNKEAFAKNKLRGSSCLSEECIPQDCHEILLVRKARLAEMRRINQLYSKEAIETSLTNFKFIQNRMECSSSRSNETVISMKKVSKTFLNVDVNQFKKSYPAVIYTQSTENLEVSNQSEVLSIHSTTSIQSNTTRPEKNGDVRTTDLRKRKTVIVWIYPKPGGKNNDLSEIIQTKNQEIEYLRRLPWREEHIALSGVIDSGNASISLLLKNNDSHISTRSLKSSSGSNLFNLLNHHSVTNSYVPGCFCNNGQVHVEENYYNDCLSDICSRKFRKPVSKKLTIARQNDLKMSDRTKGSVSFSSAQSLLKDKVQSRVQTNSKYSTFDVSPLTKIKTVYQCQCQPVENRNFKETKREHDKNHLEEHGSNSHMSVIIKCDPFKRLEVVTRPTTESKIQSKLFSKDSATKLNIICPCTCQKCLGLLVPEIQSQRSKSNEELKKSQLKSPENSCRASKNNLPDETASNVICRPKRSSPHGIQITCKPHPRSNPTSLANTESILKLKLRDKDSQLQKPSICESSSQSDIEVQETLETNTLFIRSCFCKGKHKNNKQQRQRASNKAKKMKSFKDINVKQLKKSTASSFKSSKTATANLVQYPCDSDYPRDFLCKQASSKKAVKVSSNFSFRVEFCKGQCLSSEKKTSAVEKTLSVEKKETNRSLVDCECGSLTHYTSKADLKTSKDIKYPSIERDGKPKNNLRKKVNKDNKNIKIECIPKSHKSLTGLKVCKQKIQSKFSTEDRKCKSQKSREQKQIKSQSVNCECKPQKPHKSMKASSKKKNIKHPPIKGESKSIKSSKSKSVGNGKKQIRYYPSVQERKQNKCQPIECDCKPLVECECKPQQSHKSKPVHNDKKLIRRPLIIECECRSSMVIRSKNKNNKTVISVNGKSQKSIRDKNCHLQTENKSSQCTTNGFVSFLKRCCITLKLTTNKNKNVCPEICGTLSKISLISGKKKYALIEPSSKQPKLLDKSSTTARKLLSKKNQTRQHKIDKVHGKSRDNINRKQHYGHRKLNKSSSVSKQQAAIISQKRHKAKRVQCECEPITLFKNKTAYKEKKKGGQNKLKNSMYCDTKCKNRDSNTGARSIRNFLKKICTFNFRKNGTLTKYKTTNDKKKMNSTIPSDLKKAKLAPQSSDVVGTKVNQSWKRLKYFGSKADSVPKKSVGTLTPIVRPKATQCSKKQQEANKAKSFQYECKIKPQQNTKSRVSAGKDIRCFCNTKSQINSRIKCMGSNTTPMSKRCFCTSKCRQSAARRNYPNRHEVYNFETEATWNLCNVPLPEVLPCQIKPGYCVAEQSKHIVSLQKIIKRNLNRSLKESFQTKGVKTESKSSGHGKALKRHFCTLNIQSVPSQSPSPQRFVTVGRVTMEENSTHLYKYRPMTAFPEHDQRFMSNEIYTIFPYTPRNKYKSKLTLPLNLTVKHLIHQTPEKDSSRKHPHPQNKHDSVTSSQQRKCTRKQKVSNVGEVIQSKVKYKKEKVKKNAKKQSTSLGIARFVNHFVSLFSPQKRISPGTNLNFIPKLHGDHKYNLYQTASIKMPPVIKNILVQNMICKRSKSDGQPKKVALIPTKKLKRFTNPKLNSISCMKHHQDLINQTQNYSRYQSGDACGYVFNVPSISVNYKYPDIENRKKILNSYCKAPHDTEKGLNPYARNYLVGYAFNSRKEKQLHFTRSPSKSGVHNTSRGTIKDVRSVNKVRKHSNTDKIHCDSHCAGLKAKGILKTKASMKQNVKRKHRKYNSMSGCDMCCNIPQHAKLVKTAQVSKAKGTLKINKKDKHSRLDSLNRCDSTCLISLTHDGKVKKPKVSQKIKKIPKFKKACRESCEHIKHEKSYFQGWFSSQRTPAQNISIVMRDIAKCLGEKTKMYLGLALQKLKRNPKPNPLFEIKLDSKDYRVLNREQTINSIAEWQKKEMEGKLPNEKHGENCKCCLCVRSSLRAPGVKRSSRTQRRNDKSNIVLRVPSKALSKASIKQSNHKQCVCGSTVCAKEREKIVTKLEQKMSKRKSLQKPCVCGSKVCAREAETVLKQTVKGKKEVKKKQEKPKNKIEKKKNKKKPKPDRKKKKIEKTKKKLDKQQEKKRQKLEKEREKQKKKIDKKLKKPIKPKKPQKTPRELLEERMKKFGDARRKKYDDWQKSREYKKNNKYEVSARHRHKLYVARMNRLESYATAERSDPDMRLIARSVGDLWNLGATCVQSAARHDYRRILQPTPKNKKIKPQQFKTNQFVTRATLKTVQRRLLLTKFFGFIGRLLCGGSNIRRRRHTKSPKNWGCNIYMATLRKKPCLWVYNICPWFYPHCINILAIWRNFAFFLLFFVGVILWTPCLMCAELCKVCVCCNC